MASVVVASPVAVIVCFYSYTFLQCHGLCNDGGLRTKMWKIREKKLEKRRKNGGMRGGREEVAQNEENEEWQPKLWLLL